MFDTFDTIYYNTYKTTALKKIITIILFIQATNFTANAQVGYNYSPYGIGAGISYVGASSSVLYQTSHPAYNFNFNYNLTPYVNFTLDYQFGSVAGGYSDFYNKAVSALDITSAKYDSLLNAISVNYSKTDPYHLTYINNFQMINFHADVQVGELFDLPDDKFVFHALKSFYIGTGIGIIFNSITANNDRLSLDSTYYVGGYDKSQNFVIPVRVGYQFKIFNSYDEPSILVELGYQRNYVLGYGLDGFADPAVITKSLEHYGGFHVGIKFNFGSEVSYRKPLHTMY